MRKRVSNAILVFLFALFVRLGGVTVTTLTGINPDSANDADRFANQAAAFASGELQLAHVVANPTNVNYTWTFAISPFWYLPGPSRVYARVGMALLGAFAVYNIYRIVNQYYSDQAAAFAVLPLTVLPSFVALHSVILRDVAVVCGLTYTVRLLVGPTRWRRYIRYTIVVFVIFGVSLLRLENAPIYAAMFGTGFLIWILPAKRYVSGIFITGISAVILYPVAERIFRWMGLMRGHDSLLAFLIWMRGVRISEGGRTQYLADVSLQTPTDIFLYASVGIFYFLYTPLPGMAEIPVDYIMSLESIVMLVFTITAVRGVASLIRKNAPLAAGLLAGFTLFIFFYGIISTNVGTSVRQRQTLSWLIFMFGGIGIAQYLRLKLVYIQERAFDLDTN